MTGKEFKNNLHAGKLMFGSLVTTTVNPWLKLPQQLGLDFVFIDSEHFSLTSNEVSLLCQVNNAAGITPIVRIAHPDASLASLAVESGAKGVIAPYVETREQILELVKAVKYAPLKGKVLDKFIETGEIDPNVKKYLDKRNEDLSIIINVESVPALNNLSDLVSVNELDGLLIGPHDLTINLGIPEQYENPKYLDAVDKIIKTARKANKGAGVHSWISTEQDKKWIDDGMSFIIHSSDFIAAKSKLNEGLKKLKS